jgi:hypothetical protein
VRGAVAVKLSKQKINECEMLLKEGKIYNLFPHDLQGGDLPVVPKFYGCYKPCIDVSYGTNDRNVSEAREIMSWCMTVPILLLEPCGKAVGETCFLSSSGRWERNCNNIFLQDK